MLIGVKFSYNSEAHVVDWDGDDLVNTFPHHLQYKNEKYEWVVYDVDPSGAVDYLLTFGRIMPYNPDYSLHMVDFEDLISGTKRTCECGAESLGHPGHSYWCSRA